MDVKRIRRFGVAGGGIIAIMLGATACSNSIDAEEAAEQVSGALEEEIGIAPDDVTCPEDIEKEAGTTARCELTHGGDSLGVTVTVTEVDGDELSLDIEVDEMPPSS